MEWSENDKTSYANTQNFIVEHSHFDWYLDFVKECLYGFVIHTVITKDHHSELYLDVSKLNIEEVYIDDKEVKFEYVDGELGGKLVVHVSEDKDKFQLKIKYKTTNKCKALQFMDPILTHDKKHPYMYSQCQAIHARSLFPCQDTPGIKSTYTASVHGPIGLEVLMSAVKEKIDKDKLHTVHTFRQKIPIPSYLVAIVCGNIVGRKVGPRSTVWSEPGVVESAKWEFEDIEQLIAHAEQLCGPYEWDICDVLVLPPTFPYGGMENPCLIFVTPCLLTGDRSQVYVLAHEISHSWTGNLVTNNCWDHFWINEGHTNYVERLILESTQHSTEYRHMHIFTGLAELEETLDLFHRLLGPDHEYTKLVPKLVGVDPDDAFSRVPYEKGSFFLYYLETIFGKDKMLRWLKKYIAHFRLKSLSTQEWKDFFSDYMIKTEKVEDSLLRSVEWNKWFNETGRIPVDTHSLLDHSMVNHCTKLVQLWINHSSSPSTEQELLTRYEKLMPDQKYYLFQLFNDIEHAVLSAESLELMGRIYGLTSTKNSELLYGWSILCLRSHYTPAIDQVFEFLNSQGRLKYNKPIYTNCIDWEETKERAKINFENKMLLMHPITREEVRKILFR